MTTAMMVLDLVSGSALVTDCVLSWCVAFTEFPPDAGLVDCATDAAIDCYEDEPEEHTAVMMMLFLIFTVTVVIGIVVINLVV